MPRTQIINNSQSVITKDISKKIHGIAILMMVIHHTFGFPETMLPGISYMGLTIGSISIEAYIGKMCKLCVAVFAFGTGYGLAYTKLNYSYVCHKIFNLFKIYWFSLALFIVVRLIGGGYTTARELLLNICGYSSSINGPSWYLSFYLMALLMMCALDKIKISIRFIIGACAICWIFNFIFKTTDISVWDRFSDFCIYFPVVCIGKFSAMNINLQKLLHKMVQNYKGLILSILVLIFTLGMRMLTGAEMYGFRFIWIYSPFIYLSFAVILTYLKNDRTVNRLLDFLGGYSTEFWLFHAVFISKVFWIQWLLFLPKISLFIVVWEFVLVFLVTVLYRKFCMYKGEKTK